MMKKTLIVVLAGVATLFGAVAASATETITYTYDARGRLIKVVSTGSVNNNNQTCYKVDKADNRTNVQINVGSLTPACP
jgi:hypothetical protein